MDYAKALGTLSELSPSRVVIFVGAGLGLDLGYPTWPKLIERLIAFVQPQFAAHAETMRHRLKGGDIISAADPAFEKEISPVERVRFFKTTFARPAQLHRRHRLLGNLPVAAFVTTNFDEMLETAIQDPREHRDERNRLPHDDESKPRHAVVFTGADRFRRFNSELSLYRDDYHLYHKERALVLKIHNDINDPEHIVLDSKSFSGLPNTDGYKTFYENMFRQYTVIFLGFGGHDRNLLDIVSREVAGYAGYAASESYLFLPDGTAAPEALSSSPLVRTVHYSPDDAHKQLTEFIEAINKRWTSQTVQEKIAAAAAYEDAEPDLENAGISIFDLMIPAFRGNVDKTIVQDLKSFIVATGVAASTKGAQAPNPRSVANQIAQKFGLSVEHSRRLVEEHKDALVSPVPSTNHKGDDLVNVLVTGLRRRAYAFDPDFSPSLENLKRPVRTTLESAMKAYGANLALSVLQSERPSRLQLADTIRSTIRAGRWDGIGDHDKEIIAIAISDLFMEPSDAESDVLSKMSVTAVAFGIIQAFPETNLSDVLLPSKLYLDATCVLPAIAQVAPRSTALTSLVRELRSLRRPVLFLTGFVEEVKAHFASARSTITQKGLETVGDVRASIAASSDLEEFKNVFLLALARLDCDPGERALDCLEIQFSPDSFGHLIEHLGIRVVKAECDEKQVSALKTMIFSQKKQWYGRSLSARNILARNEAIQLLQMQQEISAGEKPWFATDDSQLRRIVRGTHEMANMTLMPVAGVRSLVTAMSNASEYSSLYPRLLWNPDWGDRADAIVAKVLRELLDKIDPGVRLPLAEARDLAVKELLSRDAEGPNSEHTYESVFSFLGDAIMQKKMSHPHRR